MFEMWFFAFLTLALMGELLRPPALRLFEDSEKTAARGAAVFAYLISYPFHTFPENFAPGSSQVRSPGQVKWPHFLKSLWCYSIYSLEQSIWNFLDIMRPSIATKRISRNFDFGDIRSGQFCDLPIMRQWKKNQIPHLRIKFGNFIMTWYLWGYWSWSRSK